MKPIVDGKKENHTRGEEKELPLISDSAHLFAQWFPVVHRTRLKLSLREENLARFVLAL